MAPKLLIVFLASVLVAGTAAAQYSSDFEGLIADPNGVILTGQDGYYLPAGSTDFKAYTYNSNALTVPNNPDGGMQFIAGTSPGNSIYARAQRDFSTFPWFWRFEYDFCGLYGLTPPASNNVGSFSLRVDDVNNTYINLVYFADVNNPTTVNISYIAYDAAGTAFVSPGITPGPEWENLPLWTWFHLWTDVNFDTNRIERVGIRNIVTGDETIAEPAEWYMHGGAGGSLGTPIAFRFFAGGATGGNTSAWDNCFLEPIFPGACCLADGTCLYIEELACADAGGEWLGPESVCDPNPCEGTAVEPSTWGRIRASFR